MTVVSVESGRFHLWPEDLEENHNNALRKQDRMNSSCKHKFQLWTLFVSLAMSGGTAGATETTISTFPAWNGTSSFGPSLGEAGPGDPGAVATYGQTFTVPTGTPTLTSFSFWLFDFPLDFGGYVMQWNGQRAIGPILYDSGQMTQVPTRTWHEVVFSPLDLTLTPGQQYVFIISASKYFDGIENTVAPGGIGSDIYSGGAMVNLDNGSDTSKWTTEDWQGTGLASWDMVFTARFTDSAPVTSVPDSTNASLLVFSAAFLAFAGTWKKQRLTTIETPL